MTKANPALQLELSGHVKMQAGSEGSLILEFSGHWIRNARITPLESVLADLSHQTIKSIEIQSKDVAAWDSRLPSYLLKINDFCKNQSIQVDTASMPEGVQSLLNLALAVPERAGARRSELRTPILEKIGQHVLDIHKGGLALIVFIGEMMLAFWALFTGKARFRLVDLLICIEDAGPGGLPITTLISLLVGLILAFVGALQLAMFGAQIYIADLVALGTVREMGPLMTAIIMSGRTGASYAAQLGTMNVNSEIDALRTMGISPLEFLVLPRMIGLILVMPLLCLYADLMGISGGAIISLSFFDLSFTQYFNEVQKAVDLMDFMVGLFKSFVFAILIALAGCMRGMQCGRSASAVGEATTSAVVDSIVYIVVADSVLTLICNQLGI